MSNTPVTIPRSPPDSPGLDYKALLTEGIALVQVLSGERWTNYNDSDSGVLILQQLCYALTELSYRAGFDVADLLGAPDSGIVSLPRQGLYAARDIMPVSPVTIKQFRKLLLDCVPEAGNIWLTPLKPADSGGVNGLYRIDVLARQDDCVCDALPQDDLATRVLDAYTAHRALCEDVQDCKVLAPVIASVRADVYLDQGVDADSVMAQLLFAIGMVLSPEPLRTGLAAQLAAGRSTAEIFGGPLLLRGFIADDQLTPLPSNVAVGSVVEAMASVAGVLEVENMLLSANGQKYGAEDIVPAGDGAILHLEWRARAGEDGIRLFHDGVECRPNPARVRRLLDRAWDEQRRSYTLEEAYHAAYAAPVGTGQDLSRYSSVQEQFPAVYGIGSYGLPSSADSLRRAQARQLKGYLMSYDQLMADYFSQLAFVRDLFSISAGGDRTYAWQSLRGSVPDVAPLLHDDYEHQMQLLIARQDPVEARQTAILGFLLSLYASALALPPGSACGLVAQAGQRTALITAQRELLRAMVPATHDRGRGIDYRGRGPQQAGLEVRARIELDMLNSGNAVQLCLIEWLLLRDALLPVDGEAEDQALPSGAQFSFRVTAVTQLPDEEDEDEDADEAAPAGWRSQVYAILRANTPAHVVVDVLYLRPHRMAHFYALYEDWLQALRSGRPAKRRAASRRLATFLQPAVAAAHREPVARPVALLPAPQPAANAAAYLTAEPANDEVPVLTQIAHPPPPAPVAQVPAKSAPAPTPPGGLRLLGGELQAVQTGAIGACVAARLDAAQARALAALGLQFILRDLTLGAPGGDFSFDEANAILGTGLAIMAMQHTPATGCLLTAEQGRRDGKRAAALTRLAGLAPGVSIWLRPADLADSALPAYGNAWREAVIQSGYAAGLHLADVPLPASGHPLDGLAFDGYASYADATSNDAQQQLHQLRYRRCAVSAGSGQVVCWQAPDQADVAAPAIANRLW
ncbi:DUF1906 domain-containing protein [Duganella sp. sic0402]|uniref:glycoside hydrolase domain-containing protein n=1 Tax=Duganella sp. sic0402 TaxID=2854786 RepID=UPI001C48FF48|nr:glycoside hydrolase domain-containing protein [Duganella sp. sic0402]MBV7534710.1 DUF1906 domain-containing protein [Duganella sp. sic0402]